MVAQNATTPAEPKPVPKKNPVKNSMISLAGNLTGQFLRLGSNIVVTRMLFPEAYGIMAIVGAVLYGLQLLSDMGTKIAVIQNPKGDDPEFLDTAWTTEILRGTAIFAVGCLVAYPFSLAYDKEILRYLIPTAAFTAFIQSFISTKMIRLVRQENIRRNVAIDLTAQVLGFSSTIVHAYLFQSVWSLITGPLVQSTTKLVLSHLAVPGPKNHLRLHPESARAIRRTGRWIFISSAIMFLAQRLDVFLLGVLTTMEELGVYNIAMVLALFPMTLAGPVVNQVLLPALSSAHRESPEKLRASLAAARRAVLPIGLLAVLGLGVFAPAFFMLLYDRRYHDAGWITQLYMVVSWFQFLTEAFGRALQAMDDAKTLAFGQTTRLVTTAVSAVVGYELGGLPGFMIGNALAAFAMYVVITRALHRHGLAGIASDVKFTAIGLAIGGVNALLVHLAVPRLSLPEVWVHVGIGACLYLPVAAFGAKRVLGQVRELKRSQRAQAPSAAAPA